MKLHYKWEHDYKIDQNFIRTLLHFAYDKLPENKKSKIFKYDFEFVISENSYYNYGRYLAFPDNVHLQTVEFNFLGINIRTSPTVKDDEVWIKNI